MPCTNNKQCGCDPAAYQGRRFRGDVSYANHLLLMGPSTITSTSFLMSPWLASNAIPPSLKSPLALHASWIGMLMWVFEFPEEGRRLAIGHPLVRAPVSHLELRCRRPNRRKSRITGMPRKSVEALRRGRPQLGVSDREPWLASREDDELAGRRSVLHVGMRLADLVEPVRVVTRDGEAACRDRVEVGLEDVGGRSAASPPYAVSRTPVGR